MDAMAVNRAGAKWMVVLTGFFLHACASIAAQDVPPPPLRSVAVQSTVAPARVLQSQALPPMAAAQTMPVWTLDVSRLPALNRSNIAPAPLPTVSAPVAEPVDADWYRPSQSQVQPQQQIYLPLPPQMQLIPQPPQPTKSVEPSFLPVAPLPEASSNPAWRRAVIPPESNAAPVGRVPPPVTPGFTIGAGDTVQIDVLGRPELSAKGNVSGDGRVTVALLGPISIGGLTPVQAAERIAYAYKQGEYLVSPQVTVTMVDYQSQLLTVLGEVRSPGRFPIRTRLSVLDGLALAGGINEQGASTAYLLRPEDSVVTRYEIDLDALIQSGAGQQYFEMLAGDTLVVPKTQVFYIYGEAKNPNAYKLKPGMTVMQALSLAGGLTDKGSDKRIDIRRKGPDGQLQTLSANLNETLLVDDVLYVRERLF